MDNPDRAMWAKDSLCKHFPQLAARIDFKIWDEAGSRHVQFLLDGAVIESASAAFDDLKMGVFMPMLVRVVARLRKETEGRLV